MVDFGDKEQKRYACEDAEIVWNLSITLLRLCEICPLH
jgi:hypothetical protein